MFVQGETGTRLRRETYHSEALGALEKCAASAYDCFVDVMCVGTAGDLEVGIFAGGEQAVGSQYKTFRCGNGIYLLIEFSNGSFDVVAIMS
jgi:hypothetical protein